MTSQKLFVKREPLFLVEREGIVEKVTEIPEQLSKNPLIVEPVFNSPYDHPSHYNEEDLLIRKPEDDPLAIIQENRVQCKVLYQGDVISIMAVPAVWSGRRSCVTRDTKTDQLFRLKGVNFGDSPKIYRTGEFTEVWGGNSLEEAEFERDYSDSFNSVLRDNNIKPVMEHVGFYIFPYGIDASNILGEKNNVAASVIKVLGDSRLDELMYILETLYCNGELNGSKEEFERRIKRLYYDIGIITGRLKRLMDKNNQSWSDNAERSNAHIGNVVLYRDNEQIGFGLVDFDASSDLRDKTKKELKRQQQVEYNHIIDSAFQGRISFRQIGRNFNPSFVIEDFRKAFARGFKHGYAIKKGGISNKIEVGRLEELVSMLPTIPEERNFVY